MLGRYITYAYVEDVQGCVVIAVQMPAAATTIIFLDFFQANLVPAELFAAWSWQIHVLSLDGFVVIYSVAKTTVLFGNCLPFFDVWQFISNLRGGSLLATNDKKTLAVNC